MTAPPIDPLSPLLGSPPALDALTRAEFEDDFERVGPSFYSHARKRARHGLKHCHLRSVHWRLFLDLLDTRSVTKWREDLARTRREYEELLRQYKVTPSAHEDIQAEQDHRMQLAINNPLSTAQSSPWHQFFVNTELSTLITQDLKRTYPESTFFQSSVIQSLMLNVLLVWAKRNPLLEYRQGMNELLAPLVMTVFKDTRAPVDDKDRQSLLSSLLDRHYAEHDTFALFQQLMRIMTPYFQIVEHAKSKSPSPQSSIARTSAMIGDDDDIIIDDRIAAMQASQSNTNTITEAHTQSPIVNKCNYIHHTLLATLDPTLYKHLQALEVHPQLYGLRWYRLLFAREFHIQDVIAIWDILFSQSSEHCLDDGFELADYLCVAMLHYVRKELLDGDNTSVLRRLLKFPPIEDLQVLLDRAIVLRMNHANASVSGSVGELSLGGHSGSGGTVLSAAHHHHNDMQKFIAEYNHELEARYVDDPIATIKRTGSRAIEAIKEKKKTLNSKSGTMTQSLSVNSAMAHSQSTGSLDRSSPSFTAVSPSSHSLTAPAPLLSPTASQQGESTTPTPASQPANPSQCSITVNHAGPLSSSAHPADLPSSAASQCYHASVMHEMAAQIASVIDRLNHAAQQQAQSPPPPRPALSMGEGNSMELQPTSGENDSESESAGSLVLQSIAELKHIHGVMAGNLPYSPLSSRHTHASNGTNGPFLHSFNSPLSHLFAAPQSRETPKERLARLLREKERESQREKVRAEKEEKERKEADKLKRTSSASSRNHTGSSVSSVSSSGSGLFDRDAASSDRSSGASALLSSLIGSEKRSVFSED